MIIFAKLGLFIDKQGISGPKLRSIKIGRKYKQLNAKNA